MISERSKISTTKSTKEKSFGTKYKAQEISAVGIIRSCQRTRAAREKSMH